MKILLNIDVRGILLIWLSLWILSSCDEKENRLNEKQSSLFDIVSTDISLAKNRDLDSNKRSKLLDEARVNSFLLKDDSLKVSALLKITDLYLTFGMDSMFLLTNDTLMLISRVNMNSKALAECYWNKGNYYSDKELIDSSYYSYWKAHGLYESIDHDYYKAKMAYNMSYIQFRAKNYLQSEELVYDAIDDFKRLNRDNNLLLCYNRLLLLSKEIGDLNLAIENYSKANIYLERSDKKEYFQEILLNNLSLVYQKQQEYHKAIETLDKALENQSLKSQNVDLYAKIIDNRAYCKLLSGETDEVLEEFNLAYYLRDSLSNMAGIGISKMHLSEYFLRIGDSVKAFNSSKEAHELATEFGLNRDILSSLVLMSRSNPSNATQYMNDYISLNDSLLLEERKIQDKFSRIEFQTDEYIAANEDLKKKNVWISVSSVLGLASLSLLLFIYRQRSQNKTLELEGLQQNANQEIYDLMLKQQGREEVGRIHERVRISEELHDGALARLFSVRIGLGFLKVQGNKGEPERYRDFMKELQLVEKEIRSLSHALKNDDLSSKKDFPKLIMELLEEQSVIGNFEFEFKQDESIAWNLVDEKIKINLFRIAQESIFNTIKYASCRKVIVELLKKKNIVELNIVDDGLGFDTNKKSKGIGLQNMRSRVKNIEAEVKISSELGKGTRINVQIPTKTLYHEADA